MSPIPLLAAISHAVSIPLPQVIARDCWLVSGLSPSPGSIILLSFPSSFCTTTPEDQPFLSKAKAANLRLYKTELSVVPGLGWFMWVLVAQLFVTPWAVTPGSSVQNSPGKNTGVSSHFLLQGILSTQGSNPALLQCRQILYHLSDDVVHGPAPIPVFLKKF